MRQVLSLLFVIAISLLGAACPVLGQEELSQRLQELDQQIEASKKSLDEVASRQILLEGEVKNISLQISTLRAQEATAEAELRERTTQSEILDAHIHEAESKIQELRALYKKRVRTLYMSGGRGALGGLSHAESQPMLVRSAYFLAKVRSFDAAILDEIKAAQMSAQAQRIELSNVVQRQQELRDGLVLQRENLAKRLVEQQTLNSQLKKERNRRESFLASIRAQALRLETVLASLTNAGEDPQIKPSKKTKRQPAQAGRFSSFEGSGLAGLKGHLVLPVAGTIVQSFGKRTLPGAGASKGVEIFAPETSEVAAVAPGRVLFVGKMPELNSVVIIDHGKRYYSLYGRLSVISLEVGDEVENGQIVGKTSDPKVSSPNLYFEIRSAGVAVDPEAFFRKS